MRCLLIIHITSELSPIAKVGGLADVIYGLSKQLLALNQKILVILPKYHSIHLNSLTSPTLVFEKKIELKNTPPFQVLFWKAHFENIPLLLVEPKFPQNFFERDSIYGQQDDIDRFLLFCFLALDYIKTTFSQKTVIHLHDWPTAFIAPLYQLTVRDKLPFKHKIILTIHNLMHQGRCDPHHLEKFNLPPHLEFFDPQNHQLINLLKGGMLYCDHVTTVSPTYAKEITTPNFSYYLDETIWKCKDKLSGILNGIDLNYWNPSDKNSLPFPFSKDPQEIFKAKEKNKDFLRNKFHLKQVKKPLFCSVTRLDTQKGPALLAHACETILKQGGQYIILGKAPDPYVCENFQKLKQIYAPSGDFYFHDDFDETLAKLIYGSSDFILIPSMFEPCGLTQMIAMRYGTIPIARKTGGLADTVFDLDDLTKKEKTGICFEEHSKESFDGAIRRGFNLYANHPKHLTIIKNLLEQDFSWRLSAQQYLSLYQS